MGPRWIPPEQAKGSVLGPVHTRPFQTPSAFSLKESTFGVGFQLRTLGQAPVHREREAAQTLLGRRASTGLGVKPARAALLSKLALGLSLVSRGEFHFRECSCQKLVLCLF